MAYSAASQTSPRSHRSRRTHSEYETSPRSAEPVSRLQYAQDTLPPTPTNLHSNAGTFNVDPNAPYLASGGVDDVPAPVPPARESGRSNFVGGFAVGLRRMMQRNRDADDRAMSPPPFPVPSTISGNQARGPDFDPEYGIVHQGTSPSGRGSSVTTSETLNVPLGTEDIHDGETTAVHHEMLSPEQFIGSPVSVEPLPGSDYAKMDSPTPPASEKSLGSYMNRVRTFLRELNDLPWVAERVTVDYVPGQSKRRVRPRPTHRPIISWYNAHANHNPAGTVDLLSGSSSSASPHVQYTQAGVAPASTNGHSVYGQSVSGYAQTSPPMSSVRDPTFIPRSAGGASAAGPPPTYAHTAEFTSVPAQSSSAHWPPRYPNGYVQYQPQSGYGAAVHANAPPGQPAVSYTQPQSAPLRWGPLNTSD